MALAENPNNIESLLTLGNLCLNDLDPTAAQPYFDKVLARQPENGRAWLGIGLKALLQKNLTAAEDALEKTVKFMPSHLGSYNTLHGARFSPTISMRPSRHCKARWKSIATSVKPTGPWRLSRSPAATDSKRSATPH
ncbi:MAG: hypothetical protein P8Y45_05820 [Exilibacterium sp.]